MNLEFAVDPGSYSVILHFAENFATTAGERVFAIAVNDFVYLGSYDILQQVRIRAVLESCAAMLPLLT